MRFAVVCLLLTGACTAEPVPLAIERGGTLPGEAYDAFDRLAAGAAPVTVTNAMQPRGRPEPGWVYRFTPEFRPHDAPLRVTAFKAGDGERAAAVATELTGRVAAALSNVFGPNAASAWQDAPDEFVLAGTVTRADEQADGKNELPATQVEAVLTRGSAVVGAMQVNAVQPAPGGIAALGGSGPERGTRAEYVASAFKRLFAEAAAGREEGMAAAAVDGHYLTLTAGAP